MTANAWDRREATDDHSAESVKAYEAFVEYRNLGVQRSITQVAHKLNKSHTIIARWSTRNEWVKRVEAWDAAQIKSTDDLRDEQRKALIERELADYSKMATKWDDVWDSTKLHLRHVRKKLDDGSTLEIVELNVDDWHKLTKWRDDISKQGRRALGLPDKITQSHIDVDVSKLSDDELRAIAEGKGGG